MHAYYTATRNLKFVVVYNSNGSAHARKTVTGLRDARKVCAVFGWVLYNV